MAYKTTTHSTNLLFFYKSRHIANLILMLLFVLLSLVGVVVTQDDPGKGAETGRELSVCPGKIFCIVLK